MKYIDVIECSNLLDCSIKDVFDMIENCTLKDVIPTSETYLISSSEIVSLLKEKRKKEVQEKMLEH